MTKFDTPKLYEGQVDPNTGFLCIVTCWRPVEDADEAEVRGEKLSMSSFIACAPDEACLCGSGKRFRECCQRKRLWYAICPNPGLPDEAGYSYVKPQTALFTKVAGAAVRERLMTDIRLRCSEDTPERAFWIHEGNPVIETPQGIVCYGDVELRHNRTLIVTAMSDLRMRMLLDLLREDCGDLLGRPKLEYETLYVIDKRTGKTVVRNPTSPSSRR